MSKKVHGRKVEIICACGCQRTRQVRAADVERGWGLYYDKSCASVARNRNRKNWLSY